MIFLAEQGIVPALATAEQMNEAFRIVKERYLAVAFILGSDRKRYSKMIDELMNNFLQDDRTAFPQTVTDAHRNLVHWRSDSKRMGQGIDMQGVAYAQTGNSS